MLNPFQREPVVVIRRNRTTIRMPMSDKLKAVLLVSTILLTLTIVLTSIFYKDVKAWFDYRWTSTIRIKAVSTIMPPTNSQLHGLLVTWIQKEAKVEVSKSFATMVIATTFAEAAETGVDPFLMLALMKVESAFDYTAVSNAGALGLTQIIPKWHLEKIADNVHVYDPKVNIKVGTAILKEYLNWHKGNTQKALLQYNGSLHIPGATYGNHVLAVRKKLMLFIENNTTA